MPAAYMLADVVVSASSDPEGFGRVIIEAQAMGRPVVATDHGGARETIEPGISGWLVPPRNSARLAAAIGEALSLGESERSAFPDALLRTSLAGIVGRRCVLAQSRSTKSCSFPRLAHWWRRHRPRSWRKAPARALTRTGRLAIFEA